ncbi:MAG TPA: CHASE3 domain-containing protein [Candidatus Binataceae bacterium]|jgi:CHASE3 domain sensor protein|nr:CHASE3 domain-containing protein [Candidatus Binataceae bacterium]
MAYREFRRRLTARYLAPFILAVAVLTALVVWLIQTQISTVDWVEHSDQVIERTKDAELEMRRIQLAIRAYLYAPDKRFLDEVSDAGDEFARNLEKVAALVADNPEQEDRLLQISWFRTGEELIRQKDAANWPRKLSLRVKP